jgi:hypothetical protein
VWENRPSSVQKPTPKPKSFRYKNRHYRVSPKTHTTFYIWGRGRSSPAQTSLPASSVPSGQQTGLNNCASLFPTLATFGTQATARTQQKTPGRPNREEKSIYGPMMIAPKRTQTLRPPEPSTQTDNRTGEPTPGGMSIHGGDNRSRTGVHLVGVHQVLTTAPTPPSVTP